MSGVLTKQRFQKWLHDPHLPLLISGKYGIGKTHTIKEYLDSLHWKYTFVHGILPRIGNVFQMIQEVSEVYIIDDCDIYEFKELQNIITSVLQISKWCICISEPNTANFLCDSFLHYTCKQVSYTTFAKLTKHKYSKEYYERTFQGDIRQLVLQAKVMDAKVDTQASKQDFFSHPFTSGYVKDYTQLFNILCESYIYNNPSFTLIDRISRCFLKTSNSELNLWTTLYYSMHGVSLSDVVYTNKHWTRISNIKYRKKMFQTIRRAIGPEHIGFESYYKMIGLRNDVLRYIKNKEIKKAVQVLQFHGLDPKMVNYFPKLQCNDEYTKYTTRLKPLFSYLRKA